MKRWLFIIGIIIILSLISIWLFLLFASNETKSDIYNRFGFTGTQEGGVVEDIVDAILPDLEPEKVPLRQLTTKRVIGYAEVALSSSSPQIYFSEAGTGHIYSLNLQNGVETKISNITVAGARMAHISKGGTFAAVRAGEEEAGPLTIILFTNGGTESFIIDELVLDFTITDSYQLLYTTSDTDGVLGRSYDIEGRVSRTIFSVPFRQAVVEWGNHSEATHYVLPKPTRALEGYLYKIEKGTLGRMPVSGYGLTTQNDDSLTLFTKANTDQYNLSIYDNQSGVSTEVSTFFFPEKCTISTAKIMYCGNDERIVNDRAFPDNWYRGEVSYADNIWSLNLQTLQSNFLLNTLEVSGRELDIVDVSLSNDEFSLYFKNKNDHTLWVYDVISSGN